MSTHPVSPQLYEGTMGVAKYAPQKLRFREGNDFADSAYLCTLGSRHVDQR